MPGYVRLYLGSRPAALAWGASVFGMTGTLLAYTLLGATFLQAIAVDAVSLPPSLWAVFLVAGVAGITVLPLRKEAFINGVFTVILIFFLLFLVGALLPHADLRVLPVTNFLHLFLPYGVLLFALSGGAAIPDLVALLSRKRSKVIPAILAGTLLPAVLYFFFAFSVTGVSGGMTSEEALSGLRAVVGEQVVWVGGIVGLLAVLTSFIVLSFNFQALLTLDFGMRRIFSWGIAVFVPLESNLPRNFFFLLSRKNKRMELHPERIQTKPFRWFQSNRILQTRFAGFQTVFVQIKCFLPKPNRTIPITAHPHPQPLSEKKLL